jgi:hypothetical protein
MPKQRIWTPVYRYRNSHPLRGYIDIKICKRHAFISWSIGSIDNYEETSRPIDKREATETLHRLFREYHVWAGKQTVYFCGPRWGGIVVRREQVGAFMRRFQPFWFGHINAALREVVK